MMDFTTVDKLFDEKFPYISNLVSTVGTQGPREQIKSFLHSQIEKAYLEGYKSGGGEVGKRTATEYVEFEEKIAQRVAHALEDKAREVSIMKAHSMPGSSLNVQYVDRNEVVSLLRGKWK